MGAFGNDSSIEGDVYVQRLATYIRRNEEALANGLLCFSKTRSLSKVKPLRPSFTIHHLYYVTERIANSSLDVDIGPLNIKLDTPNHEPTFISFMANKARNQRHFESDAKSITSINSVKSIVSSASVYWMSFLFSKDPKVIQKDVKYLYSSFTKIPCLVLSPHTKINSIEGYEEYPCDTSLPLRMFKNLQVFELFEYEPHEVYGWDTLSEKLRILIIRKTKVSSLADILFTLVFDDENGRSSFNSSRQSRRFTGAASSENFDSHAFSQSRSRLRLERTLSSPLFLSHTWRDERQDQSKPYESEFCHPKLPDSKWQYLKQLTVSESSITSIMPYVFEPLANLVKLNLSGNLLDDLPDGLHHLHNIKYLNLADNYITNLKKLPLNLKHLTTVNFNNNKLECLDGIQNLLAVQKVDLRRNKLNNLSQLKGLVQLVAISTSELNNVFISSNGLPKTYRAELFNLFNGAKLKNNMKIDDSRPGYFESAMLLDPEAAVKQFKRFISSDNSDELDLQSVGQDSTAAPPSTLKDSSLRPHTPDAQRTSHRLSSTTDVLESLTKLDIQDLENTITSRKHSSVMTTASSTAETTPKVYTPTSLVNSAQSSPSLKTLPKSIMPLLPNQNLSNQPHYAPGKLPPMVRQYLSPMLNLAGNGSESTLRSSVTMHRLDMEAASLQNPAPNVITAVQVQVEGFQ